MAPRNSTTAVVIQRAETNDARGTPVETLTNEQTQESGHSHTGYSGTGYSGTGRLGCVT